MKKLIQTIAAALLLSLGLAGGAVANEGGIHWDKFPEDKMSDMAALQHGAKLFVNYCLNCHGAAYMRYNRLRDIGLTDDQIKSHLLFAGDKVGDLMKVSIDPKQAKAWFGANPPDLSVISRSRAGAGGSGADYLYTYLRSYYRDDAKATGWNNRAFPNVAMPNVLWELQGQRGISLVQKPDPHHEGHSVEEFAGYTQITPGSLTPLQFDDNVADLVAYLQWMGEPAQGKRVQLGVIVLIFLSIFTVIAWRLNAAYWRDVK